MRILPEAVTAMGRSTVATLRHLGAYTIMVLETFREILKPPYELSRLIYEVDHLGVRSLSIVTITALFTGMVLAMQSAYSLASFGAKLYVAKIVSLSLVRELGPVLTALMVAGRVGAGITAEIGSMAVTEQVDAIRVLGASPVRKLVVPKVLATLIMLPLLTTLADVVGILGGLVISVTQLNIGASFYWNQVIHTVLMDDFLSGIGKSVFFALFISTIGCYNGLTTTGGADGVGRATTLTVVLASISVLISDFFLTKLFLML